MKKQLSTSWPVRRSGVCTLLEVKRKDPQNKSSSKTKSSRFRRVEVTRCLGHTHRSSTTTVQKGLADDGWIELFHDLAVDSVSGKVSTIKIRLAP